MDNYIKNLITNIPERNAMLKVDLIMEGGAYNGYYGLGCLIFLKELEKQKYIQVNRISGASVGAMFGTAFVLDQLDDIVTSYKEIRDHFKQHLNMSCLKNIIRESIDKIDESKFNTIKKDKIFLTYYNKSSLRQKTISEFKDKDDLIKMLQASAHIPYITGDTYFYEDDGNKYIDGGTPYIFPERKRDKDTKILYISITNLSTLRNILSTRNERTPHGRMLEGVLDTYKLFMGNGESSMCSYVDDWSYLDFLKLRIKQLSVIILIYSLLLGNNVGQIVYPYAKDTRIYNILCGIIFNCYQDFMIFNCF